LAQCPIIKKRGFPQGEKHINQVKLAFRQGDEEGGEKTCGKRFLVGMEGGAMRDFRKVTLVRITGVGN